MYLQFYFIEDWKIIYIKYLHYLNHVTLYIVLQSCRSSLDIQY